MIIIPTASNDWIVPWDELQKYEWVRAWIGSTQDPIHHAEGDVWIHTRLVLEALVADPDYRAMGPSEQEEVYLGALFHDVAKPFTRRENDDGRISNPGHSVKGEIETRRIMWEMGYGFDLRERVCGLVRYHQVPYFAINDEDARRRVIRISVKARCDLLAMLAKADINGRICADAEIPLFNIEMFKLLAEEYGVLSTPFAFPSDHTRYVYFHGETARDPSALAYDNSKATVIVMCGLPGSGKDTWIKKHHPGLPVVSMDDLREEMDVEHGDKKGGGQVVQAAKELAKEYLRRQVPFIWNATNISLDMRRKVLTLMSDYGARIHVVYVEAPHSKLFHQNKNREASVPEAAIWGQTRRWQLPDLTEGHQVDYITQD